MGDIRQHVRRSQAGQLLLLDVFQQLGAGRPVRGLIREVVNERVGIEKAGGAGGSPRRSWRLQETELVILGDAAEGLGIARPLEQPGRPFRQVSSGSIVRRTLSCSFNGNGRAGLRTPFS